MYIRQTATRSKKDGNSYQSYRLVESFRIGNKVKQQTLLNLGTEFSIPREFWSELTNRIEALLHHQPNLLNRLWLTTSPQVEDGLPMNR